MPNTIAQNLTRLANAKEAIAEAIEEKGVTLGEDDGFEDFADAIMEISGGGTVETKVKLLKSIKSVGNSVIMTDIIPQFTDEVHMTVQFSGEHQSASSTDCFFGVQGADPWFLAANPSGTSVTLFVGYDYTKNPAILNQGISINQAIPLVIRRNGKCICGEVSSVITSPITGDPHNFGCSFFGVSFSATNAGCFSYYNLTIYDAKIINSLGVTIHHLIPAEDQLTHRGGLYDLITGKFYPSDSRYDDLIKETGAIDLPSVDITYPVQKMHYVQVFNSSDPNINYDKELNTDGTLNSLNAWYTSDYIDTLGASQIKKEIHSGQRICFYDSSKNFISYSDISTDGIINIPTNAKYFRFNGQTSSISTDMILLYFPNGYPDIPLSNSLISKTITQNGTYSALEDDAIGYSTVTVTITSNAPIQKYNAAQGGWAGGVGYQVQRYRSEQEAGEGYYDIRCCIDHFVFFDNDSDKTISIENSNIMVAVGVLTESTYGEYKYYYKEYDSGWQSLPYTVSGQTITPDKPITITFRKTDNSEITPSDIGVVTIT